ncbi:YicC/YloC family endoribonuclease [Thermodesulfobacteriota bacterium]
MKCPVSMTSFGRGESSDVERTWIAEIRSVNHRYCDVNIKISKKYAALEERIRKEVSGFYNRGRIDITINSVGDNSKAYTLGANLTLAREYYQCLESIRQELNIENPPDLTQLVGYKDIVTVNENEEDLENIWGAVNKALILALQEGLRMREAEGRSLTSDLQSMLTTIFENIEEIDSAIPEIIAKKQATLQERLDNILKGVDIDQGRLAQEVAFLADKADITEELVRLRSHIKQFSQLLETSEPVGRRLDFLLQEFIREINTIASKIGDASVAHVTVGLKNEVEKMREQVQNLE